MKLPISIFPNITEYARANWNGYLEPRDITVTNHTDLGSDVTWEMFDKGTIHIHKPREVSLANALMEWKIQCPDNTKVVLMAEHNQQLTDFVEIGTPFSGIPMTRKTTANPNSIVYVSNTNGWTLTGLTFGWSFAPHSTDIYISLVNGDRLDACLTGNHLKSISVGDKLGLVYWDGYTQTEGKSISVTTTKYGIDPARPTSATSLGWVCVQDGTTTTLSPEIGLRVSSAYLEVMPRPNWLTSTLKQAGTIDLSGAELTVESFEQSTGLQDHLFHVI